jgi:hypothetical protein
MAKSISIFRVIFFLACTIISASVNCQVTQLQASYRKAFSRPLKDSTDNQRFYAWTQKWLHVRENNNDNRSPIIDQWNIEAGVPVGSNYCGSYAFAGQNFMGWASPSAPAWTPAWNKAPERIAKPDTGDKFLLYYPNLKRIGHIGFVVHVDEHSIVTSEGNTNVAGSRTGIGVFNRRRPSSSVRSFVRWKSYHN